MSLFFRKCLLKICLEPLGNNHNQLQIIVKRCVFSEQFLKIDTFRLGIDSTSRKYRTNFDVVTLKQSLVDSIQNNSVDSESFKKLNDFLYLAKTRNDFEILLNATKLLRNKNQLSPLQLKRIGPNLMRAAYVTNNIEIAFVILREKTLNILFESGFPHLILMNKLILDKKYESVVYLFESFFKDNRKFDFPIDQLDLASMALLKMNSTESLKKTKQILDAMKISRLDFIDLIVARFFILAIKQGEPEYGLELVKRFANVSSWLAHNLNVIALSQIGAIDDALNVLGKMLDLEDCSATTNKSSSNTLIGKFFPFTIESLKIAIDFAEPVCSTRQVDRFDGFRSRIENKGRFLDHDLSDYCNRANLTARDFNAIVHSS